MDFDSYYYDSWRMDPQPYAFGLLDDTAPTYDAADGLPEPAPFIGPSSDMANGEQGYAQLYVDTFNDEGMRQMLDALLPLVSEQAAMPTPTLGTNAAASLQHDDATLDPQVLHTNKQPTSTDAAPTMGDDEPPSPLTESTPGLWYDAVSFAASPLPDTPLEAVTEQAASHESTPAEPEVSAEELTPTANQTVKRSTKRARTPDSDYEPSTKQNKKRKTKRGRGDGTAAQTRAGDDLGNSHLAPNPSSDAQASSPPAPSQSGTDDRADAQPVESNAAQPGQKKVRKAKRRPGRNSTGAGPGSNTQSKTNDKSRPALAIQKYASDVERRKVAFRVALRTLRQPDTATALPALPSKLGDDVVQALQNIINAQPDVPRSGDDQWVECDLCLADYGILERVLKDKKSEHKHDCHDVTCCVVCGCPVVRGDLEQWRKHRKSNCPPWRVAVKLDKHIEWLESNGQLDAGRKVYHRQFFDKKVRDSADRVKDVEARRTLLVDALKAKELAKLPKTVHSNEPFKGMIAKKVLAALEREIDSESAEA